jgi:hypothetical protein
MFGLLGRRAIDADRVVGNAVLGDVSGTLIQNFHAGAPSQEPILPWRPLPDDRDIFKLLHWRFRLGPELIGRGTEQAQLLAWVNGGKQPRARFLVGPGGAGKSRLAAEVADQLRRDGWTAGFARLDRGAVIPVRQSGILLIVDYPEEQREQTRALLADLAAIEEPPAPVRMLLLSRRALDWWAADIDASHAADVCDAQSTAVGLLDDIDVRRLLRAAAERLANHLGQAAPDWSDEAIDAWLAREPKLHALPLFVVAAAVYGVLEPDAALGVSGREVIDALVRRERQRLANISEALGLEAPAAARLLGLAAAAGGLNADAVRRLADRALELGLEEPGRAVDRVRHLPWWEGGRVPAPSPDVVAAALLLQVLAERTDRAPEWLWAALQDSGTDLADRLARLGYDQATLYGPREQRLANWLAGMIAGDPGRARQLEFITEDRAPMTVLPLAIAVLKILLTDSSADESTIVRWLNNLSNHLREFGDGAGALAAIRDAVKIYKRLAAGNPARFEPALATGLNNLSNRLSDIGDGAGALAAIRNAVEIYERLKAANPARFEPDLAPILNNLSNRLSVVGDGAGALAAIHDSVEIYKRLAAANPVLFEPYLATSLDNLSSRLRDVGDWAGALAAIRDAVKIYKRLAAANPARFEPALATGLNNLSNRLSDVGNGAGALAAIRDAVEIRRRLAAANSARFEPDLAMSLNNLSTRLREVGNGAGALAAIRDAIEISRRLAAANPARFEPELAMSLNNLSNHMREAGDGAGALAAIRDAVQISRRLAAANPAGFEPDLAMSLNNFSTHLREMGDRAGALAAIRDAVKIYKRLAAANPARFEPDLAMSLNNLSLHLSDAADGAGAIAASGEAVEIYKRLAAANPGRFEPDLAISLTNLSAHLSANGDEHGAETARGEVEEIRRRR